MDKKKRIFNIIQIGTKDDLASNMFDYAIVITIIINLLVTFLNTYDELVEFYDLFYVLEWITIGIFTIEYVLRLWTAEYLYPAVNRSKAVIKYIFSFYGLIDLFTFMPFYLPFFFPSGVVAFRIFRVIRIFRLFRINAQYDAFNVITNVIKSKGRQILSSMALLLIVMMAASLTMYSLENEAQPEVFKNAFSGMWWAMSAMLTVGYGDIYPVTTAGQFVATIIALLGVLMVAIPTGIISAGFVEEYRRASRVGKCDSKSNEDLFVERTESGDYIIFDGDTKIVIKN